MTTAAEAVKAAGKKLLGRDFGATGQAYWENDWNAAYAAAKAGGASDAAAAAAATGTIENSIGAHSEAKTFAKYGIAKTAYEGTDTFADVDKVADWYTAGDYTSDANEWAGGTRDVDWATKLNTGNLEGFLKNQNYQYGTLQGNTVGQEGNEWWGYQKNLAIDHLMSDEGGNYSFATASKIADADVAADIARNSGHENFIKYGSIGYGNPLEIKTAKEANVDSIASDEAFGIDEVYLNFDPDAMAALKAGGLYEGSGFISGTDEDGNLFTKGAKAYNPYYIDDDGNVVTGDAIADDYSGDLITDDSASGFTYKADSSVPGGYRIIADSDKKLSKIVAGEESATGSEGTVVSGYMDDRGNKTFEIPTNVTNVDASRFAKGAANKLDLSTWAENPANAAAVAAGDFSYKNIGAGLVNINGQLTHVGTTKQGGDDTNLGLNKGETITIIDDTGKTVGLTGGEHVTNTYTTNTSNLTENIHNITEGATNYYYGMGGGGNKTIIATPPPPSKTAKEQQIKEPTRIINQAPKRDQYNKIRGRGPTQIPGAGGGLSIPVG
tara:strand:- start:555 stop:2213 length:1659 start_codon:yes stop_codon:yes gene_type:complete